MSSPRLAKQVVKGHAGIYAKMFERAAPGSPIDLAVPLLDMWVSGPGAGCSTIFRLWRGVGSHYDMLDPFVR